jgi:hypothetical protein
LEKKYSSQHSGENDMKKSPSGQSIGNQPPNKRAHLRIQHIPPFNANKIRKSPSASENEIIGAEIDDATSSNRADEMIRKMVEKIDEEQAAEDARDELNKQQEAAKNEE